MSNLPDLWRIVKKQPSIRWNNLGPPLDEIPSHSKIKSIPLCFTENIRCLFTIENHKQKLRQKNELIIPYFH